MSQSLIAIKMTSNILHDELFSLLQMDAIAHLDIQ